MPFGPPAQHQDSIAPSQTPGSTEYTAPTKYDDHPAKRDYGSVVTRFEDEITITRPAPDIDTLRQETVLTAQLHNYNRYRWNDSSLPNDATTLYDLAILDVMEQALEIEDFSSADFRIPDHRLNFIFLKRARLPADLLSFYAYLESSKEVRAELGFPDAALPSYETLRKEVNDRFPDELDEIDHGWEAFDAAVVRAVYAVYRNGINAPTSVTEQYGFDTLAPPLSERDVPRPVEKTAIRNWVRKLISETLEPLQFDRERGSKNSFKAYLGLFATSALCSCGFQDVPNVADYHYPRDVIPKGSGIGKHIRDDELPFDRQQAALSNSEIPAITEQFDAVHRKTLDIADRLGIFDGSQSLGVDLYHIEWGGKDNDVTINRPAKSENEIRSQWTYALLGVLDTDARFTLGVRQLHTKSEYPNVIRTLTSIPNDFLNVEALFADNEMVSGSLLDVFRGIAGSDYAVRAPDHDIVKKLRWFTPNDCIGYVPNISWNTTPRPNLIAYPYEGGNNPSLVKFTLQELRKAENIDFKDQHTLSDPADPDADTYAADSFPDEVVDKLTDFESVDDIPSTKSHAMYLTDRSLSNRSPHKIHSSYYQRWAIEHSINQVKHHTMPVINSPNKKLRLYGMNMSVLFHNWHTLINRALSPQLKLPLDITHTQLLKAIQFVAFSDTS